MKNNATLYKRFGISLMALLVGMLVMPMDGLAQRSSTDKGKVTVRRGDTKAAPRKGARSASKDSSGKKATTSSARGQSAKSRSAGAVRSSGTRSDSDRGSKAREQAARSNEGVRNNGGQRNSQGRVIQGNRSTVVNNNVYVPSKRYAPRLVTHVSPRRAYRPTTKIAIHIGWPWLVRYERHWSPRYRYRQTVYVTSSWGTRNRAARVEMETIYKHKVNYANNDYAVLDIQIEEVLFYENGRFIGSVDRIPSSLSNIEATAFRNGEVSFDRDVFVVGDRQAGFEMISTRFYDDYALAGYRANDGYRAGKVNLRSGKVSRISRSRLFDPRDYNGFAPISLLPEEEGWLWDYGADAISAWSDDYDAYYGYGNAGSRGYRSSEAMNASSNYDYSTGFGANFKVERQSDIQRVE